MKFVYIKKLGSGVSGSAYLVKNKNKYYALKIQHIFEKDISDKKSDIWKEISFFKYVTDFTPLFKKFYSYNIITDCDFKKNNKSIGLTINNDYIDAYKKLQASKYCIEYVTSYEEDTLGTILDTLSIKQVYSLILQISYGIMILQKKKYTHNDLNINNITFTKTTKKHITININNIKYKIPIFSYIYTIIDYGGVQNPYFINNIQEKKVYLKNYKKMDICNLIDNIKNFWFVPNNKNNNSKINYVNEFENDIEYMEKNSDNIKKIINYFENKLNNIIKK